MNLIEGVCLNLKISLNHKVQYLAIWKVKILNRSSSSKLLLVAKVIVKPRRVSMKNIKLCFAALPQTPYLKHSPFDPGIDTPLCFAQLLSHSPPTGPEPCL